MPSPASARRPPHPLLRAAPRGGNRSALPRLGAGMRAWVWVWMLLVLPLRLWAAAQMPLAAPTSPLPTAHGICSSHAPHPAHSPSHPASRAQPAVEAPTGTPPSSAHHAEHHAAHPCCPTDAAPTPDAHTHRPSTPSSSGCADPIPCGCANCAICHSAMIAPPLPPNWAPTPQPSPTQPAPAFLSAAPLPELRPPIG